MREILFRGKTIDGKWVYGFYVHNTYSVGFAETPTIYENHYIYCKNVINEKWFNTIKTDVIPETIGQFTGLTDKNGKKIFEGDIVGYVDINGKTRVDGCVKYGNFNCSCCDGVYGWYIEGGDIRDFERQPFGEVIGNVHDNPELLGE